MKIADEKVWLKNVKYTKLMVSVAIKDRAVNYAIKDW